MSVLIVLALAATTYAEDRQSSQNSNSIAWGDVVNGLQLGIAPPVGTNGIAEVIFDGENLRAHVFCRNTSEAPVRLLASVHTCLLGGDNPLFASGVTLTPKDGGNSITVTYRGWNHLALLDKRRKKGQQPQSTLNDSFGGKADIELSEEDAKRMTTVLAPSATGRVVRVQFAPNKTPRSWWWLKNESDTLASGTYSVTAFLTVDQEQSDWKGTLKSGALEVQIVLPKEDGGQRPQSPTKPSTSTE
jgi:hypothetical protein